MIHPFFAGIKAAAAQQTVPAEDVKPAAPSTLSAESVNDGGDEAANEEEDDDHKQALPRRKRRKTAPPAADDVEDEPENKTKRRRKRLSASLGSSIVDHFKRLDAPSPTASTYGESTEQQEAVVEPRAAPSPAQASEPTVPTNSAADVPTALTGSTPPASTRTDTARPSTPKPKKMLQLNKQAGTIGSPPKTRKATALADKDTKPSPKRGRPRKKRLAVIRYGQDTESRKRIGEHIESILSGPVVTADGLATNGSLLLKSATLSQRRSRTPKITHPFFTGKPTKGVDAPADTVAEEQGAPKTEQKSKPSQRQRIFSSTPCSPKKSRAAAPGVARPVSEANRFALRVPGAQRAPWPGKDMVRVRADESRAWDASQIVTLSLPCRKSKGNVVQLSPQDGLLARLSTALCVPAVMADIRQANSDDFSSAPLSLRLPQKHLESGRKLMKRVSSQLRCIKPADPETEVSEDMVSSFLVDPPPQLQSLYTSAFTALSAYDRSMCETACWTQKYSPTCAAEVIQPGKEVFLLKQWLERLMVQAVDTGAAESGKSRVSPPPHKKTKKRKKLDGFIVSSDEEYNEMDEISDDDVSLTPAGSQGGGRKTVVRLGDRAGKRAKDGVAFTNAVVISGPHGSGKTAAVYAVAKELGFDVFELNSASRRAGKDVLERIGDMTRNHHVRQRDATSKDEAQIIAEDVAKEVESGKQATMNSFFKVATAPKATRKPKRAAKKLEEAATTEPKKTSAKPQKQSLILLDEADILFEEDKQFWSTVIGIMTQSKRPFVITCNDESLVPLSNLNLHAILRFSAPQADLSIDRMLLVAACEGHALRRKEVEALYDFRGGDLRAAMTDLNYWCQTGVGDRRGGFDWFVLRWPRGIDLDGDGHTIRVISGETYKAGMGWLDQSVLRANTRNGPEEGDGEEEELLQQAWDTCSIDLGDWHDTLSTEKWVQTMSLQDHPMTPGVRRDFLQEWDRYAEAISAADICSGHDFACDNDELLDPSLPDISQKMRADFVEGLSLLDARPLVRYASPTPAIGAGMQILAKTSLERAATRIGGAEKRLPRLDEKTALKKIREFRSKSRRPIVTAADFNAAFHPLTSTDDVISSSSSTSGLTQGSFLTAWTLHAVATDVAPYIRSIVAFDARLAAQRRQMSSLLSEGGAGGRGRKKMRTTRSALSALEGGERRTTRADRWFKVELNGVLVGRTGGMDWGDAERAVLEEREKERDRQGSVVTLDGGEGGGDEDGLEGPRVLEGIVTDGKSKGLNRGSGAKRRILDSSEDELAGVEHG